MASSDGPGAGDVDPTAESTPRISLIVPDSEDHTFWHMTLASLERDFQKGVAPESFEVLIAAHPERVPDLRRRVTPNLARVVSVEAGTSWWMAGLAAARGDAVGFISCSGAASPRLVATLCAALDAYPGAILVVPTFRLWAAADVTVERWLTDRGWPREGDALIHRATNDLAGHRYRWLDPVGVGENVVVPREALPGAPLESVRLPAPAWSRLTGARRVQIVGDAFVVFDRNADPAGPNPPETRPVDSELFFFGTVRDQSQRFVARPTRFRSSRRPSLSVILVTHDMRREAPRTLRSFLPPYQRRVALEDYEIIVIDNGSKDPLTAAEVREISPHIQYHVLTSPPPSPAYALNFGATLAKGDVLALMNDGGSMASPGVFATALDAFRCFPRPVVITQFFYLGPGRQNETMLAGYDKQQEDELLHRIAWPTDGYRLLEIASPASFFREGVWLSGWFESDCIVMHRNLFEEIGGCDERFDFPGGGLAIMDLLVRSWGPEDTQPVKLVGEGVFHQLHGGISTNAQLTDLEEDLKRYAEQYVRLRGPIPKGHSKAFYFIGQLHDLAAREKMCD